MQGFILFMCGLIIGIFITAITQANRNAQDRERAEHAIKQAKKYRLSNRSKELIQCKDCVFYERAFYGDDGYFKDVCRLFKRQLPDTHFCGMAERKKTND